MNAPVNALHHKRHDSGSDIVKMMLRDFTRHPLSEQNRAALMTRVDDKFVIKKSDLPSLLIFLKNDYSLLAIDDQTIFDYQTTYYDTEDYQLYHLHHRGKSNRLKVRIREYLHSKECFLEIKEKNNKGITHKHRHQNFSKDGSLLLNSINLDLFVKDELLPKLQVNYQRITMLHKRLNQRITIDINLNYLSLISDIRCNLSEIIIIEIKRDRYDYGLRFSNLHKYLKSIGYFPSKFSKYCMGCVLTQTPSIKVNRFKDTILYLNKLLGRSYV